MNKLFAIIRPVVTEKSTVAQEKAKYEFIVKHDASKTTIKKAFEEIYGVKVASVRTRIMPNKTRTVGRGHLLEKRPVVKRAVVTVEKGKTIDINKIK
jgi:large subunit ribosomal protein L23